MPTVVQDRQSCGEVAWHRPSGARPSLLRGDDSRPRL